MSLEPGHLLCASFLLIPFAALLWQVTPAGPREIFSDGHFATHAATVLKIPVYVRELQLALSMAGVPNQYFNCMDPK